MHVLRKDNNDRPTAILMSYSKDMDKIKDAYWAQTLSMYSVMIAAAIGMVKHNISKFHSVVATTLVGSPLTFYMALYALRSCFGHQHRLHELFDTNVRCSILRRIVAFGTLMTWIAYVGSSLLSPDTQFAQSSCQARMSWDHAVLLPILDSVFSPANYASIPLGIAVIMGSWGFAIYRHRKALWHKDGVKGWPTFFDVW
jgi:hypothetical protein